MTARPGWQSGELPAIPLFSPAATLIPGRYIGRTTERCRTGDKSVVAEPDGRDNLLVRKAGITADLVSRLVASQFPRWAGLPVRPVEAGGWDNATFRLWFHGDAQPGNLLARDGRLCAVIDFGTCGVGDPACDTTIAWTFLSGQSSRVFKERLPVDSATWARGRGWAIWKAMKVLVGALDHDPEDAAFTAHVIAKIMADHLADR